MPKLSRQVIVAEFMQSYRQTSQLFFKSVQNSLQDQPNCNQGYLIVLKVLKQKGSLSQHAIAKELFHSDAAVSRQIAVLLEKGYIATEVDPSNRRTMIISLTSEGKKLLTEVELRITSHLSKLLDTVSDEKLLEIISINQELQQLIIQKPEGDFHE